MNKWLEVIFLCVYICDINGIIDEKKIYPTQFDCHELSFPSLQGLKVIKKINAKRSYVVVLKDEQNVLYILKQNLSDDLRAQFSSVRDMFGAYVAEVLGISMSRVRLISADQIFPGKFFVDMPATLHTFVPGKMVLRYHKSPLEKKRIKQYTKISKAAGVLGESDFGLTQRVIKNMSCHPVLCEIVAVDTYVANADRSRNNLFYDQKTKMFYGIDMDNSCGRNLCELAYRNLIKINKNDFNKKELNGLKIYRKTLVNLLRLMPAQKMVKKLDNFACIAGFYSGSILRTQAIENRIKRYKECMYESEESAYKLVALLDEMLQR
jgi:hypothetical protein